MPPHKLLKEMEELIAKKNQPVEKLVINTITSPKRAFMRQESKLAKLCVNLSIKD